MSQSPANSSCCIPPHNSYLVRPNHVPNHLQIILCISISSLHLVRPIHVTIPGQFFFLRPTHNSYLVRPIPFVDYPFLPNPPFVCVKCVLTTSQIIRVLFFASQIYSSHQVRPSTSQSLANHSSLHPNPQFNSGTSFLVAIPHTS